MLADGIPTFQFNFKFSLGEDMYAQDSIDLLTRFELDFCLYTLSDWHARSGIHFQKHEADGIDVHEFGELLITSVCAAPFFLLSCYSCQTRFSLPWAPCYELKSLPFISGVGAVPKSQVAIFS